MRSRWAAGVAAVATVGVLAGCATVPTSGAIRDGRDIGADQAAPAVRVIGRAPAPGASQLEIVTGFLQASADLTDGSAAARAYLTPEAAVAWAPTSGVTVYGRAPEGVGLADTAGGDQVTMRAPVLARIDGLGHFAPTAPGQSLERQFRLRKVDGQWRILTPGPGLLLTEEDLGESFRRLSLYFVSPGGGTLVPDPVFVPSQPRLATLLVQRLVGGVPPGLDGAASSALPVGSRLRTGTVPVNGGVARVDLSTGNRLGEGLAARRQLSAQLVWTLKQLAEVQAVRIVVDGTEIRLSGVGANQPRDSWASFDPSGLNEGSVAYAVRAGTLGRLDGTRFSPVPGPAGDGRTPLRVPAVSLDASRVAGVSADGTALVVGGLQDDAIFTVRLRGTDLSPPSWDVSGDLWVVDRRAGSSRLLLIAGTGEARAVSVDPLAVGPLLAVRVARDGARAVVLVGPPGHGTPYLGVILRGPGGAMRLGRLRPVLPGLTDVADLSWSDATTLALIGRRNGGPSGPVLVSVDGASSSPVEPIAGLVSIAAAPGSRPLIAATSGGLLVQFASGRGWTTIGPGQDPTYPG